MSELPLLVRHGAFLSLFYFFCLGKQVLVLVLWCVFLPLFQGTNGHAPGLGALNHNKEPDSEMSGDKSQQPMGGEDSENKGSLGVSLFVCGWLVPGVNV